MVCRDADRGETARAGVQQQTGNTNVELLIADLSSQQSIRHLVQEFESRHDRLHVLINNAGASLPRRVETVDGLEIVFATNHLGAFRPRKSQMWRPPLRLLTATLFAHSAARLGEDEVAALDEDESLS